MSTSGTFKTKSLWQRAVSVSRASAANADQSTGSSGQGGSGSMFKDKSSFQKLAVNLFETKRVLDKEKEIKAKCDELDALRDKCKEERDEKQQLQRQIGDLTRNQSDAARKLARTEDVAEKLRGDNRKKTEQIEKLERNISHMEDRIRNLEIRASEVEKAELTLDSTRRNLESSVQECRMKEKELEREREKYDEICKQLEVSNVKMREMERKIDDLKLQVRCELMKNENIERGLETIPRLKEEIKEKEIKIKHLEKDLSDKAILLNASRKTARDYKEKLREHERRDVESICLSGELEVAKNEVDTLKRLMSGKDMLVLQKCQSLDKAKEVVSSLRSTVTSDGEKVRLRQIQQVLDQLRQLHTESSNTTSDHSEQHKSVPHNRFAQSVPRSANADAKGISVNHHPYALNNNDDHGIDGRNSITNGDFGKENRKEKSSTYLFLERFLDDTEGLSKKHRQSKPSTSTASKSQNRSQVYRSVSCHHIDQNQKMEDMSHSNSNALPADRRTLSSHNLNRTRPVSSKTSPRSKKSASCNSTTTMYVHAGQKANNPNLYTSENGSKFKFQPSLEYSIGVSTDEDLTTDTSHCLSARHSPSSAQPRSKETTRPRSAFTISKRGHSTTGSDSESGSHDALAEIVAGKLTNQQLLALSQLSGSQKDAILDDVIQIGDRVSITVSQKPPRYGRKKPKPVTYTGMVKYKGLLDKDHFDARIYVGLRLDSPLGESDGTYRGKRYMFTPQDHAKFFKIRDLESVLDVPTSMYIPTTKLILRYVEVEKQNDNNNNNSNNSNVPNGSLHETRPESRAFNH